MKKTPLIIFPISLVIITVLTVFLTVVSLSLNKIIPKLEDVLLKINFHKEIRTQKFESVEDSKCPSIKEAYKGKTEGGKKCKGIKN